MKCVHCGKEIADDSMFCNFCGTKIVPAEEESSNEIEVPLSDSTIIEEVGKSAEEIKTSFMSAGSILKDTIKDEASHLHGVLGKAIGSAVNQSDGSTHPVDDIGSDVFIETEIHTSSDSNNSKEIEINVPHSRGSSNRSFGSLSPKATKSKKRLIPIAIGAAVLLLMISFLSPSKVSVPEVQYLSIDEAVRELLNADLAEPEISGPGYKNGKSDNSEFFVSGVSPAAGTSVDKDYQVDLRVSSYEDAINNRVGSYVEDTLDLCGSIGFDVKLIDKKGTDVTDRYYDEDSDSTSKWEVLEVKKIDIQAKSVSFIVKTVKAEKVETVEVEESEDTEVAKQPAEEKKDEKSSKRSSKSNDKYSKSSMTSEQQHAYDAGLNYLSFMPFSKKGLIDQLSSEYGDNYPLDVAEFAVEAIEANGEVDWVEQAKKSAQNYLEMMDFSKAGLIDQLSSEYGDQYTREQAEQAVEAVY